MNIIIGIIIAALLSTITLVSIALIIRRAWYGFHRLVGISPGKMKYIAPEQLALLSKEAQDSFRPQLIQVSLSAEHMKHLPLYAKQQLQRIDDKADIYQEWRTELEKQDNPLQQNSEKISHTTENQFVLSKLMGEHLPKIVITYHNIIERKQRIQTFDKEALSLLTELLDDIEVRLDVLLKECEQQQLQSLQVMKRYLQARD